ncbi:MAG: ABC transporter permease [Bacteroidota bacterium]|nr:ABC transporter permease [Bacteroidota bacterium]
MRTILYIIQKEFIQISRNRSMLPIIFVLPIVQLIILVNAATLEMKRVNMCIVDSDLSSTSRQMTDKFKGSPFFKVKESTFSMEEAEQSLQKDKIDVILRIPQHFERDLVRNNGGKVQVIINAINGTAGGIENAYITNILMEYNKQVTAEWVGVSTKGPLPVPSVAVTTSYWFNPQLNYKTFMVPAVLLLLVTIIGMFLSSLNLVREKELGTIEQINVTPIHKYEFIAGKLIPFWIIALFELGFGLTIGKLLYNIPMLGSLWLLFGVAAIYLLVVLGIGLLISTSANTQQQAMFVSFFFMIVFVMMSGIFTPVESMPVWAQRLNLINPIAYFMRVIRMILLKGSGFTDILKEVISLAVYAWIILTLAVWRYRKVA